MKPDKIEQKLEQLAEAIGTRDSFVDDVMSKIECSPVQPGKKSNANVVHRRMIMYRITKFTAAAVIMIGAFLALTVLNKTVTPAYALEHTITALHSVRSIHMRKINPQFENAPVLLWAEFFENGQPKSIRMHMPEWKAGADGPKEIIWKDNIATVWFKKKKGILRVQEKQFADQILQVVKEQDPKFFVQNLLDKQSNGQCDVQIIEPEEKAKPIKVTTVYLPDKKMQLVLYVDQDTHLPIKSEKFYLKNAEYVLTDIDEFFDYNQSIAPSIFTFDNVPEDVVMVDQTQKDVGLVQGDLTDDEAAVETARQFWQAAIDKDYETAGKLLEGLPPEVAQHVIGRNLPNSYLLEIVSVGPVQPHHNPKTGGVIVPCTLKVERDGIVEDVIFDKLGVRPVYNQPGQWTIFGGL